MEETRVSGRNAMLDHIHLAVMLLGHGRGNVATVIFKSAMGGRENEKLATS